MSETLFGNPDATSTTPEVTPPAQTSEAEVKPATVQDPNSMFADQLSSIKRPDGQQKFDDVSKALESIPHANTTIQDQAEKIRVLEEEVAKRKGVEEMVERMGTQAQAETPSVAGLDETTTTGLIESALQRREVKRQQDDNRQTVLKHLQEKYGDKAEEVFNSKASELGLGAAGLTALAISAPLAALAYFDVKSTPSTNSISGSVNTASLSQPKPQVDLMAQFNGSDGDQISNWRKAKP